MKKFAHLYNKCEEFLCGVGTVIGLCVILFNVFSRYVFHSPHATTDEISLIILAVATILGFSVNVSEDNNIDMDLLYTSLKNPKHIIFFDIFKKVCMCVYSVFIAYYGYQAVYLQYVNGRTFPISGFPFWVAYSSIVYVGIVLAIRCFAELIRYVASLQNGGAH